jgi:hypothetical protein
MSMQRSNFPKIFDGELEYHVGGGVEDHVGGGVEDHVGGVEDLDT